MPGIAAEPPADPEGSVDVRVVLLGSGTPAAEPDKSGPATAVVIGDQVWLVDAGPGIVRRAAAASRKGVTSLRQENLSRLLLTHLHSDHTLGLPDLILSPWTLGRLEPLSVWGPVGTQSMTQHLLAAYDEDIRTRLDGEEPANTTGWRVEARDIQPGVFYRNDDVTIEAVPACHGSMRQAFGYKFTVAAHVIVISGDTTYCPTILEASRGVDILIHEVYDAAALTERPAKWRIYHKEFHTSSHQLAQLAAQAQPKLLVLYHQLTWGGSETAMLEQIRSSYRGRVVWARDLDEFAL
jgi:ribonuclease BN (tRNA processing enzyme)